MTSDTNNSYKIGDKFMHVVGLEMTYMDSVRIGDLDENANNPDDLAHMFAWLDNNKLMNKLYFYDDQVAKWMKKVE